jgi:xanthine dehydrogenase accessory factor
MDAGVLAAASDLARARRAFALATVVWRRGPNSGRLGSKAIVFADGTVQGWLGGACSEPVVVREALAALVDGQPRLCFLGSDDDFGALTRDGMAVVPMACANDGAVEVYVEPFVPGPHVVVVGRSPAVHALTLQAHALGWDVAVVDRNGHPDEHPLPELVRTALSFDDLGVGPASAIVIATQGHYDGDALRAALATDAGYIGVVAAARRAQLLRADLTADGIDADGLARVHAPAGLDLGSIDHIEIAVAILADLVTRRASGEWRAAETGRAPRTEVADPVCGMTVVVDAAAQHLDHDGQAYWFCSEGCRRAFARDPSVFLG